MKSAVVRREALLGYTTSFVSRYVIGVYEQLLA
jgi:hypothetical protein